MKPLAKDRLSRWRERFLRGKLAGNVAFWAAAAVLLIFTGMAVWPQAWPHITRAWDVWPIGINRRDMSMQAGGVHWLGTDHQGRDVLSRVIYGAQVSLTVGYSGVIIGALVGIAIGLLAGYRGGTFDQVAMRVVDAWLSFPVHSHRHRLGGDHRQRRAESGGHSCRAWLGRVCQGRPWSVPGYSPARIYHGRARPSTTVVSIASCWYLGSRLRDGGWNHAATR